MKGRWPVSIPMVAGVTTAARIPSSWRCCASRTAGPNSSSPAGRHWCSACRRSGRAGNGANPVPDDWLSQAGSQWRMEADGSLWQRSDARPLPAAGSPPACRGVLQKLAAWALHPDGHCLPWPKTAGEIRDYRITLLDLASGETLASCLTAPAICSGVWLTSSPP